jgi:hypothetical protein
MEKHTWGNTHKEKMHRETCMGIIYSTWEHTQGTHASGNMHGETCMGKQAWGNIHRNTHRQLMWNTENSHMHAWGTHKHGGERYMGKIHTQSAGGHMGTLPTLTCLLGDLYLLMLLT